MPVHVYILGSFFWIVVISGFLYVVISTNSELEQEKNIIIPAKVAGIKNDISERKKLVFNNLNKQRDEFHDINFYSDDLTLKNYTYQVQERIFLRVGESKEKVWLVLVVESFISSFSDSKSTKEYHFNIDGEYETIYVDRDGLTFDYAVDNSLHGHYEYYHRIPTAEEIKVLNKIIYSETTKMIRNSNLSTLRTISIHEKFGLQHMLDLYEVLCESNGVEDYEHSSSTIDNSKEYTLDEYSGLSNLEIDNNIGTNQDNKNTSIKDRIETEELIYNKLVILKTLYEQSRVDEITYENMKEELLNKL